MIFRDGHRNFPLTADELAQVQRIVITTIAGLRIRNAQQIYVADREAPNGWRLATNGFDFASAALAYGQDIWLVARYVSDAGRVTYEEALQALGEDPVPANGLVMLRKHGAAVLLQAVAEHLGRPKGS